MNVKKVGDGLNNLTKNMKLQAVHAQQKFVPELNQNYCLCLRDINSLYLYSTIVRGLLLSNKRHEFNEFFIINT